MSVFKYIPALIRFGKLSLCLKNYMYQHYHTSLYCNLYPQSLCISKNFFSIGSSVIYKDIMDDNVEIIPSKEVCQELIEEFCRVTNTDEALAQCHLQDSGWKLQPSLNSFFESQKEEKRAPANSTINLDDSDISVTFQSLLAQAATTEPPKKFRFLTWNLDGLDTHNLKKRTKAVAKILEVEKPDVVFFQEVIPATYALLEEKLPQYFFISGGNVEYFTATLLNKTTVHFDSQEIHSYLGSTMGRNLLLVDAHIGSLKLRLFNTHLESTMQFTQERKSQLREALDLLASGTKEHTSILAGDLNLRDKEAAELSFPKGTSDLWQCTGSREACRYTWDLRRNTNKHMPCRVQPRHRFDRVYLHQSDPPQLKTDYFGLEGINKVSGTQSFPSDHWAIMVHFSITKEESLSTLPPSLNTVRTSRPELSNCSTAAIALETSSGCTIAQNESGPSLNSKKRKRDGSIILLD